MLDGMYIIDADGHVDPAIAVDWRAYVPGEHGERLNALCRERYDRNGDLTGLRRGGWEPKARLEDMDAEGIDVAVLFGDTIGLNSRIFAEPEYGVAVARGWNDWLAEYCAEDPERLKGAALLPLVDPPAAVRELRRAVEELGFVCGILKPFIEDRNLDDPIFFPVYAEAQRLDVPLTVHGPGEVRQHSLVQRYKTHAQRHMIDFPLSLMIGTMDTIIGGLLDRFPTLRLAMLEGGVGWVPWWLDRLDEHFELRPNHMPRMRRKATQYVAEGRLLFSCECEELALPFAAQVIGADKILYASDYPHWDCPFPNSARAIGERAELSPEARRQILGENAAAFFKLRVPVAA